MSTVRRCGLGSLSETLSDENFPYSPSSIIKSPARSPSSGRKFSCSPPRVSFLDDEGLRTSPRRARLDARLADASTTQNDRLKGILPVIPQLFLSSKRYSFQSQLGQSRIINEDNDSNKIHSQPRFCHFSKTGAPAAFRLVVSSDILFLFLVG